MPDLRQALKDFVATSNSGKYADEETLMSKFPELKGYDIQTLKDFVATSNSGKYADENELFSKFPEFNTGIVPSKKKFGSELTSQEADVESTSKPTQQNTSLGTNQQEEAQGSDTLDGLKPFDPLEGLIKAQQKTIKETTPAVTKQVQPTEEEDYFTGGFGNFLRGVDNIIPLGIGDFVDDMARGVASGYRQGRSAEAAGNLIVSGANPSDEEITQFIESRKSAEEMKPSAEMNNYQKIYQEEGKGFWGVVKGLANNPSILPELLLSSLTSMATNTDAIKAGVATIIAGGSIGAATGATGGSVVVPVVGTGIGAGAGAIAGAEAAIPFAFGAASAVVEMGSTFGELLQEELGDKEMSKENVRAVLENPDKLQSIRNKAIARGLVIGTIDTFTGKLATGVGAKILTKSAAKSATGAVTRAATTKAVAAGAAVESLGGSFGETAARAAIGQDMDISEIALEGLAELPGGIRSTIQAKFAKPSYRVNGEKVTAEDIDELTRTMTPEQLYATKIVIKNDYEGRQFKIQDKIVTNSIKEDVRRANPELNEPSLNAITQLEKELKGLEGNKTQTGKDKASAIRTQIKNIQENQLQDEVASEYIINEKQYSKENFLKELEGKTPDELKAMKIVVNNDEQTAVNINEKFKTDAIQEQSTTTIPVQSETTTSETMETGVSESGPEVVTEEEVVEPRIKDSQIPLKRETFEFESAEGDILDVQVTTTKDGTREFVAKNKDGNVASSQKVGKDNTLTTEEYVTKGYGPINGEPKVEQGNDIMAPAMKDKLTPKQKAELGIEETAPKAETAPTETTTETAPVETKAEVAPVETATETETVPEAKVKTIGTNPITSIDVVDDYNDMTKQYRDKKKAITLLTRDNEITTKEAASLTKELFKNLKEAKSTPKTTTVVEDKTSETTTETAPVEATTDTAPTETTTETAPVVEETAPVERTPIEIQESRVKSAQSLLDEAKTKTAKKKAMTDLVTEQGRLAEMKAFEKTKAEVAPKVETAPTETTAETAPVEELNDLLNVDTKEEGGLKKVYDFLDSLDTALDLDPNELNDVTRVMAIATAKAVVKTLKALVKAGMTLQEAIKQVASDQNLKVRDVVKGINALSEITKIAPGYNALMEKADALIARQKAKGIAEKKIISNLDTMIRKSPIYMDPKTTDAQRKIMEREARAKMGVAPKKSVSIGRVIGALNDIRNVSRAEKLKIISRIRALSKDAVKDLVEEIRELAKGGKITPTQSINIISRFGKVNMLNEASVSNFVDYMTKVFADAEYDNKIKVAKGKLKNARKSIATKIGIANGLVGPLQKLFSINPELIPESYLEKYLELVDMFGARQAVLNLEEKSKVTKDVLDILDEINNERSAVDDLSYRLNYSDNKVIEDGKLNYAATVKNMLKEGDITEEEAALMTKYKSEIVPQTEKSSLSEEELQQEKDDLVEEVKKSTINADDLPTRTERDAAKKLAELLKSPAIKELSNTQLKNLLKVIDNINNGYFPHFAHLITEEINSINNSKALASSVNKAKPLPLSKLYAKAKSILTRKDAILEMIRRNPLFNIDQVFGDFKTKDIFNSILGKAAEAEAKFTSELKAIQSKLSIAEEKIAKSFTFKDKLNANKVLMSKFKMMTYMVQLEYNSNPDSKQVNPAAKFIEATINHINEGKSQFGEKDAEMLQEILDKYTDADGNIDVKELYNSFNSAEKAGIKTIQEINQSLKEKAEYTASVIRGQRINPLSNYIHLNVLSDTKPNDLASGESFADQYNNSLKPSTKAKSLIERTGKVSPLNFDVFASAQKGAKFVLMDFHLTEPIRTARKTINKTIAALGKIDKDKRRIINAINNSFEEAVENLVKNSYMETSAGDDVVNYISKQGYRSVLAGTGRFVAEFLSNAGFVIISDPTTFAEGLKHTAILMSSDAPSIMNNVNSKETNRIFPSDTLSGRLIDTNILSQASGIKGGKAKNKIINRVQQIWNRTGKRYKNAVELTADVLITTPDKAIMRPIWFGSFAANFKKQTGQDVDFKKIAANDETYMNENKEAIEKAKNAADERSVITGASNNSFTGILKGTSKPNQSNFIKGFNNFNNFMTRFLIYEYTSARTGIYAAMGNGSLSRRQGIALLGAVTTRMTVYSLLSKALGSGLIGLLFGSDDDEEEEKKSLDKSIGQALTSTFTSLLFNRDFGNATKMIINEGVEKINENYLQELREGDYDPYEDALQYRVVPIEKKGGQTGVYDFIANMSGSYGPAIKTTNLIIKTYREGDKKEADAIQRQEDVKNIRIPLEVLGNAGFIPLYKDIRKEVMKEIYKKTLQEKQEEQAKIDMFQEQLDKAVTPEDIDIATEALNRVKNPKLYEAEKETIKNMKESLLTNEETGITYDNISDVKKYDRPLWEKNFGPDSEWYQVTKGEREVEKLIKQKETEAEEEKFNYVKPKRKSKNSDGTYKKSSSSRSSRRGFGGSSSSSSSSTTERYDSRGVKITTKKSSSRRRGFN